MSSVFSSTRHNEEDKRENLFFGNISAREYFTLPDLELDVLEFPSPSFSSLPGPIRNHTNKLETSVR